MPWTTNNVSKMSDCVSCATITTSDDCQVTVYCNKKATCLVDMPALSTVPIRVPVGKVELHNTKGTICVRAANVDIFNGTVDNMHLTHEILETHAYDEPIRTSFTGYGVHCTVECPDASECELMTSSGEVIASARFNSNGACHMPLMAMPNIDNCQIRILSQSAVHGNHCFITMLMYSKMNY